MPKITFHYSKSPNHADVKVDGALGGPAATGDRIVMSVYTERNPIPRKVVHELMANGELGAEVLDEREGKEGIIRTVHVTLDMDLPQARAIRDWLAQQIGDIEEMRGENGSR